MAPEKDPAFEGMAPGGDASGLEQTKAKLDDSELSDDLPKSLQKVDLDLDDAPFLEDEEEPEPEAPAPSVEPETADETAPAPWWKKKKIVLPAGAGILLVIAAAVYFLLFAEEEPPPPPPPPPVSQEEPAPEPAPPPEPVAPELTIVMDPFLVEVLDSKGQTRFLTVKFAAVTTNADLEKEMQANVVVLRDAIYYYLKNKNLTFLTDDKNGEILKKDVLSVVNQFLSSGQLENLQIEEYLVK